MIRINLLGVPKPKKGKKGGGPAIPDFGGGEGGGNPMVIVGGIVLLAVALNGGYWYKLNNDARVLAEEKQKKENERVTLSNVKKKYDERKKQADLYERRVRVIEELRSQQSGPSKMLDMIAQTVNSTDAVWLNTMKDEGAKVQIDGMALSSNAVANLITNLKKQEMVKNVELAESIQDDQVKEVEAFSFKLTIEKQAQKPATAAPATQPAEQPRKG